MTLGRIYWSTIGLVTKHCGRMEASKIFTGNRLFRKVLFPVPETGPFLLSLYFRRQRRKIQISAVINIRANRKEQIEDDQKMFTKGRCSLPLPLAVA